MIQSGQLTPQRANELKADVYAATRLGNTPQGQQAMNAAISASRDKLPMQGYDPAAMYRNIGSQLSKAVSSGQMTSEQARQLQAPLFEATKLGNTAPGYAQMNSGYNRAIDAIRNASPAQQPQGGLTMAEQPEIVVTAPQGVGYGAGVGPSSPMPVMPTPTDMREVIGSRMPPPGVRGGDTRIFADQPMAYPGGDPNFDESTGVYTPDVRGIGGMLSRFAQQFRNAETMPKTRPGILGGMQPRALTPEEAMGITSAQQPDIAVKPQYDMPVMPMQPSTGMGLGKALGMPMQPQSIANAMQQPQGLTLSNVPRTLTLSNVPQQPAAAPQGMAMGGLMRKYGGMC
jgi:hypothetical protein